MKLMMLSRKSKVAIFVVLSLIISLTVVIWIWISTTSTIQLSSRETIYFSTTTLVSNLDDYAEKAPTRIKMFVTYHNSFGEQSIQRFSRNYTRKWVIPLLCNATKYFEYYAYKELIKLSLEKDLKDIDYVIMTGYKTISKEAFIGQKVGGGVFLTEDLQLQTFLEYARLYPEYDFIPFFINNEARTVAKGLPRSHGIQSMQALTTTLQAMNWTNYEIQKSLLSFEFYRNTFMIRSTLFLKFAKEMTIFIETIENHPTIEKLYQHNAKYGAAAKIDVALKTFGTPYYQLHCFIAERMPTVFLNHLQAKAPIALIPEIMKLAEKNTILTKKQKERLKRKAFIRYWTTTTRRKTVDPALLCLHSLPIFDKLIRTKPTRIRLFVTYHDPVGERVIRYFSCGYTRKWIIPLFYNRTKGFEEYSVYKSLDSMALTEELKDVDYVIMTNFKLVAPHEWGLRYDQHIDASLDDRKLYTIMEFTANHTEYDVVPVYPSYKHLKTMSDSSSMAVLRAVLHAVNMTEGGGDVGHAGRNHEILRNTYLAKTETFIRLVRMMASTIDAIEANSDQRASNGTSLISQVTKNVMENVLSVAFSRITNKISIKRFDKS